MADTLLDVVNDNDEVIGQRLRSEIHREGLLHREVHVWFVTPNREVIFQRRSPTKDVNPNMLGASVGGHVEIGQTYLEAALRETQEETGLHISEKDIIPLFKVLATDTVLNGKNMCFRQSFLYRFLGDIQQLHIEKQDGNGFVQLPLNNFQTATHETIVPTLLSPLYSPMWDKIRSLV